MTPSKFIHDIMKRYLIASIVRTILLSIFVIVMIHQIDANSYPPIVHRLLYVILVLSCVAVSVTTSIHTQHKIESEMNDRLMEENYELSKALNEGNICVDSKIKLILKQLVKTWGNNDA